MNKESSRSHSLFTLKVSAARRCTTRRRRRRAGGVRPLRVRWRHAHVLLRTHALMLSWECTSGAEGLPRGGRRGCTRRRGAGPHAVTENKGASFPPRQWKAGDLRQKSAGDGRSFISRSTAPQLAGSGTAGGRSLADPPARAAAAAAAARWGMAGGEHVCDGGGHDQAAALVPQPGGPRRQRASKVDARQRRPPQGGWWRAGGTPLLPPPLAHALRSFLAQDHTDARRKRSPRALPSSSSSPPPPRQASNINKSLSALGNVIMALADLSDGRARHVHFRDSKLTFLLKARAGPAPRPPARPPSSSNPPPPPCCRRLWVRSLFSEPKSLCPSFSPDAKSIPEREGD